MTEVSFREKIISLQEDFNRDRNPIHDRSKDFWYLSLR